MFGPYACSMNVNVRLKVASPGTKCVFKFWQLTGNAMH